MNAHRERRHIETAQQFLQYRVVLLDYQAADVEVVQPKVAVTDVDLRGRANVVGQRSQAKAFRSVAEFHAAVERLSDGQGVEVLAAKPDERHSTGRLTEERAFVAGVDQVGHRRDGPSAVAFDRIKR